MKFTYQLCKSFPKDEVYGLQSPIKPSAVSIPSNVAKGYGRSYTRSYIQFLRISRGSLLGLETQTIIAKELNFVTDTDYKIMSGLITEKCKMIYAFLRSIEKSKNY